MKAGVTFIAIVSLIIPVAGCVSTEERELTQKVVTVTATQKGGRALDRDEYGGNPFASALIQSMAQRPSDNRSLIELMQNYSELFSDNFQKLDLIGPLDSVSVPILPANPSRNPKERPKYIALVAVMAEYDWDTGLQPLPGAAFDAIRVSNALKKAGYDTQLAVVKNAADYMERLSAFGADSENYDAALLYTTGHGTQIGDDIYLLDTNYAISRGGSDLKDRAINLKEIENMLRARQGNFILYAGCRDNPLNIAKAEPEK